MISGEVLTITRESHLIAQVQVQFNQLKLVSLRPLSARLLEALFELALDRRESLSMDEHFCKWADVIKWRLGLASLGYEFTFEKITDVSAQPLIWRSKLKDRIAVIHFPAQDLPNRYRFCTSMVNKACGCLGHPQLQDFRLVYTRETPGGSLGCFCLSSYQ